MREIESIVFLWLLSNNEHCSFCCFFSFPYQNTVNLKFLSFIMLDTHQSQSRNMLATPGNSIHFRPPQKRKKNDKIIRNMFSSYFNFNLTNPRQGKQTTITYALSIFASYTTHYNYYADCQWFLTQNNKWKILIWQITEFM